MNVLSSISRVQREEMLYRDEGTPGAGTRRMWRPKQMNVGWMKDLVRELNKDGDVVMEVPAGVCFTAKACMLFH